MGVNQRFNRHLHMKVVCQPVPESETVVVEDATPDSGKKRTERRFQTAWKDSFPWLRYEAESDMMYCSACIEAKVAKHSKIVLLVFHVQDTMTDQS